MARHDTRGAWALLALALGAAVLAGCDGAAAVAPAQRLTAAPHRGSASVSSKDGVRLGQPGQPALPVPGPLTPFAGTPASAADGQWHPAGRTVAGRPAVYETLLVPPGGSERAGIAWIDTSLLTARLYSGSLSPGGTGYKYTAPVTPAAAQSLVAAFNGGFKMADAHGGYYTEGRVIRPLVRGAESLVIYADGAATVGTWGSDVTMTRSVVAVRQNLFPLVVNGRPSARSTTRTWRVWGGTCPCGPGKHGTDQQWRSGLGVTADGALVYVAGPALIPVQLADLLARAGVVRGMELDINPSWPDFASYQPAAAGGLAGPSNGTRLIGTYLGPAAFFSASYARDFVTLSAVPAPAG